MDKLEALTLLDLQQQDLNKCTASELVAKYVESEKQIKDVYSKLGQSGWHASNIKI